MMIISLESPYAGPRIMMDFLVGHTLEIFKNKNEALLIREGVNHLNEVLKPRFVVAFRIARNHLGKCRGLSH